MLMCLIKRLKPKVFVSGYICVRVLSFFHLFCLLFLWGAGGEEAARLFCSFFGGSSSLVDKDF